MIQRRGDHEGYTEKYYPHGDGALVVAHALELGYVGGHHLSLALDIPSDDHNCAHFGNGSSEAGNHGGRYAYPHFVYQQPHSGGLSCAQRYAKTVYDRSLFLDDVVGETDDDGSDKNYLCDDHGRYRVIELQTSQWTSAHQNKEYRKTGYDRR